MNTWRSKAVAALTAVMSGSAAGCVSNGSDAGLEVEAEPAVAITAAALSSAQSNAEQFQWTNPDWDVTMRPVDSHLCFLTGVGGEFGSNSNAGVHRSSIDQNEVAFTRAATMVGGATVLNEAGTHWKVSGYRTSADGTTGEATCVPRSDFVVDPGGELQVSRAGGALYRTSPFDCDASVHADLWDANAVSFLMAIQGEMEGFGEMAEVTRATSSAPARVHVTSERCDELGEASARSLLVGVRDDGVAPYVLSGGEAELVLTGRGERHVTLLPTSAGVCYLTKVAGGFHGRGERVRIVPSIDASGLEAWVLSIESGGAEVTAKASCVYYDQRYQPVAPPF